MSIDTPANDERKGENGSQSKAILTMKRVKIGTITTATRISPAAAPAKDWTKLIVPRTESWHQGMTIATCKNQPLFTVVKTENIGTDIEPKFQVFIGDKDGKNILAVVMPLETSVWGIYTCFPGFEEQRPSIRLVSNGKGMYLYGKFCEKTTFRRCTGEHKWEATMKAEITRRSCRKSPLHATFFKPDQLDPVISRDQKEESVIVAPGENLLLSVCISYIIDVMAKSPS